ncbi:MAG: sigma-70 family RNA polymerase sigma factor [Vicinamibacterales bacterium]
MSEPEADAAVVMTAVSAVRRGDHHAFSPIVELFQRRLFGLALMMTREPMGAEEVVQDAFVRAFQHLDAYDIHRPFYPWISTITVRLAQNWLVRFARQRTREGTALDADHAAPPSDVDSLTGLITGERDRRLWESVSALPSGERTAVILYYRQDMSVEQIASAVGVSGGTIKTLLFRGRQKLRRSLGDLSPRKDLS